MVQACMGPHVSVDTGEEVSWPMPAKMARIAHMRRRNRQSLKKGRDGAHEETSSNVEKRLEKSTGESELVYRIVDFI